MLCLVRIRLLVFFLPLTICYGSFVMAQGVELSWDNQVIQMRPDDVHLRPPVVTAVSLQPGGPLIATAGDDHLIRVLDSATGRQVQRLDGHTDWVRCVAYSPDGETLASAGNDGRIILWDAADGVKRSTLASHSEAVVFIVYSNDGGMLAAAGFEERIRVYDTQTTHLLYEVLCPCRDMRSIAFSPDDQLIAAGGRSGEIRLWNAHDGSHLRDIDAHPRRRIRQLLFSHHGDQIISCGEDRKIRISNVHDEDGYYLPSRPTKSFTMTLVGPGQLAAAGSDNRIHLWDLDGRKEIGQLSGHSGSIAAMASQGSLLISAGYDTTIRIWQTRPPYPDAGPPAAQFGASRLNKLD